MPRTSTLLRLANLVGIGLSLLIAWTVANSVFADEKAEAKIFLTHPTRPGKDVRLNLPVAYLATQSASGLKNGQLKTNWLYVVLKYSQAAATPIQPPSAQELRQDSAGVVHLFVRPATRSHHSDQGRWFRDQALKDIEHDGTASIPWSLEVDGVSRHSDGRDKGIAYFVYENESGKLVFVKCFLVVCNARRTFNDEITIEYRFERTHSRKLRDLDSRIDVFLTSAYHKP